MQSKDDSRSGTRLQNRTKDQEIMAPDASGSEGGSGVVEGRIGY